MNDISYQNIFSSLEKILPQEWKDIVLYVQYDEISYSMVCYVDTGDGTYKDCYEIPDIPAEKLSEIFSDIDNEIYSKRCELPENEKWYVMTMKVHSDGAFSVEYDYNIISGDSFEYFMEWRKKHINR